MDYLRLIRLILRHKWLILGIVIVATAGTFLGARLKGKSYTATATLMPQEQALQTMDGVAALSSMLAGEEAKTTSIQARKARVQSLIALMMSPRVLGQVIAKQQLPFSPADLQRLIRVDPITSEVLQVRATAGTPELATQLANGLVSTFVQFYGDLSTNAIAESTRLLNDLEAQAKKDLLRTKNAVAKYKAERGISSLQEQISGTMGRLGAAQQALEGTKAALAEMKAQVAWLEEQLQKTPSEIRIVEKSNQSPAAEQLRNEIAVLEKDLALERGVRTEEHPRVRELTAKLTSTKSRLRQEEGQLIERVRTTPNPDFATLRQQTREMRAQRDGLVAKAESLSRTVVDLGKEMQSYTGADVQLSALMQRYSAAEHRYTSVISRLRQAEANADSIRRSSAIAIVDTAGPMNPAVDVSQKRTMMLTAAACFLSLAMCIFILAAWDYLDRGIRTSDDAEALVEMPVAAIIPRALPRAASTPLPQLTALMPASPEGEAYRFLALHLMLSRPENPLRVLMLATAKPGQGATTTISNLAAVLAQGNRRVILVDADLRRPSHHGIFNVQNEVGLTSVLTEGVELSQALQRTPVPGLLLLTGGPIADAPWALLRSSAMEQVVSELRQMADFVLIDTPSAAAFADAFNVAPLVDGVFMVVRQKYQPTGLELKIKRMFEEAGAKVFGAVLNDVPMGNVESCRYHSHYYGPPGKEGRSPRTPALPAGK